MCYSLNLLFERRLCGSIILFNNHISLEKEESYQLKHANGNEISTSSFMLSSRKPFLQLRWCFTSVWRQVNAINRNSCSSCVNYAAFLRTVESPLNHSKGQTSVTYRELYTFLNICGFRIEKLVFGVLCAKCDRRWWFCGGFVFHKNKKVTRPWTKMVFRKSYTHF